MKISVIIPVYNVEKYLKRCLDSVISQKYKNLEIILIDDGSTDNSGKICDEYAQKDKRIIVIHKENGGLSDARNKGLEVCTGDYISFVDSDDWIEEDFFEYVVNNAKDNDLLIFDYYISNGKNSKWIKYKNSEFELTKEKCLIELTKAKIQSYAWNKVYKINLFNDIRFPKGRNYEDQAIMHLIVEKSTKIKYCNKAFYNYYQNPKGITHTVNYKNYRDFLYVNILRGRFLKKKYPKVYEYHLNYIYSAITKLCWLYKNDERYVIRYQFLRKFILSRFIKNIFNTKITLRTKIKILLYVLNVKIICKEEK